MHLSIVQKPSSVAMMFLRIHPEDGPYVHNHVGNPLEAQILISTPTGESHYVWSKCSKICQVLETLSF